MNLPLNWHFNSDNFVKHVNQLTSPIPAVSLSAFCFTFAHALAESSQFYLQSAAALVGEVDAGTTARRQSQAVDNLIITLDAIGDIGRHSPQSESMLQDFSRSLMKRSSVDLFYAYVVFFPLHIVSSWLEHTNTSLPRGKSPSLQTKQRELKLRHWWTDLRLIWGVESRATPRTSNADLKRSASARQQQAPLPVMRQSAHPSPMDQAETSRRSLIASPATNISRGDFQPPPSRSDGYLTPHQPERALNIPPRKLSDLLDNAPSRHVITAPKPDVLPRGSMSLPTSNIELRHSKSPTDDRRSILIAQNGPAQASEERSPSFAGLDGRERKRPRLSEEDVPSARREQKPTPRSLSNEHEKPHQGNASEKPSDTGMNGMSVLATAAAASR